MPDTFGNPETEPVELTAKVKEAEKRDPEKIRKAIDANPQAYTDIAISDRGYQEKLSDIEDQIEEDIKRSGLQKEYTQTRIAYLPIRMDLRIEGKMNLYQIPVRIQISSRTLSVKINRNNVKVIKETEEKKRIKIE